MVLMTPGAGPVLLLSLALALAGGCSAGGGGRSETTTSGLEITWLEEGSGPSPGPRDTVVAHYHGTFPDGKVFDSSVERGQPMPFPLNRVIPCWTEALQMMKTGDKVTLVCPPELAYGARGAPGRIPPNSTLHFEVELIEIR